MKSREIFLSQPILLELEAPLKICGKCGDLVLGQGVGVDFEYLQMLSREQMPVATFTYYEMGKCS